MMLNKLIHLSSGSQQEPVVVHHPQPSTNEKIYYSENRTSSDLTSGKILSGPSKMPSNLKHRELDKLFFRNYTDNQIDTVTNFPINDLELSMTSLRKQMSKEIEKCSSNFLPQSPFLVYQDHHDSKCHPSVHSVGNVFERFDLDGRHKQVNPKLDLPVSEADVAHSLSRSLISTQLAANFSNNLSRNVLQLERNAVPEFSVSIGIGPGTAERLPLPLGESKFESPKVESYERGNGESTCGAVIEKDDRSAQGDYVERVRPLTTNVAEDVVETVSTKSNDRSVEKRSTQEASNRDLAKSEMTAEDANEEVIDNGRKTSEVEKYLELMKSASFEKKSSCSASESVSATCRPQVLVDEECDVM